MKRLHLSGAMFGLTVLLGACSSPTPPSVSAFSLTVKLGGVTSAPVTVTNTTTSTQVFSGTLEGSKTFGGLKAGDVFKVEGGAVNTYVTPTAQSVTLDVDKTLTLTYAQAGGAVAPARIAGRINGNTLKIARVILNASAQPPFGVADVDATNSFDLDLSGQTPPAGGFYLLTEGCTATGANTNPTARVWGNSVFDAYGSQGDHLGTVEERVISGTGSLAPQTRILRMYALADTTFQGTCSYDSWYGSTPFSEDYDITLKAGWNAVAVTESGNHYVYRNVDSDTRTELRFFSAEPGVSVSLNPATLTFSNDAAVTVDAQLTQVGGYSGTVTLKTDDPNLTVEPSTLTLPALTAQALKPEAMGGRLAELGLSPQSLTQKLTFRYTGSENTSRSFALNVLDASGNRVGGGYGSLVVQRPGINLSTYAPSGLEVTPNSSVKLYASLSSTGNFSGTVTLRLEGLPEGITADTRTVSLDGYASSELTLTGGETLTPGEYAATLIAEGGGYSARSGVKVVVPKPTVSVQVQNSYSGIGVYQGTTGSVRVNVSGNAGFRGSTTLTLTGLPAGVSANPVTVNVVANATTTVDIPLQVEAGATLGSSSVRVTGSDVQPSSSSGYYETFQLNVKPARTLIGTLSSPAPAAEGLWFTADNTYTYASGGYQTTFRRFAGGKTAQEVKFNNVSPQLLPIPGGDVYVLSSGGNTVYRLKDDGTTTLLTAPSANRLSYGAVDSQGRVWFIQSVGEQVGAYTYGLCRWDPATGSVTTVDTTRS